jgi:hypothetical protein
MTFFKIGRIVLLRFNKLSDGVPIPVPTDLCKHSFVVIVVVSMSRQMGQVSSLCRDFGLTAISATINQLTSSFTQIVAHLTASLNNQSIKIIIIKQSINQS